MGDPRKTRTYQAKRKAFLASHELICHWCGKDVYQTVPAGHPNKATVDHGIEVDRAPSLALDVSMWVVACWPCNSGRGADYRTRVKRAGKKAQASRDW